jgi:hypothetical protein
MKNVSFKKVCGLSLVVLFLSNPLQAGMITDLWNGATNLFSHQPVKVAPAKFGSKQWFKEGVQKVAQTRAVRAVTDNVTRAGQTLKAHPVVATIAAAAVVSTVVAYWMLANQDSEKADSVN